MKKIRLGAHQITVPDQQSLRATLSGFLVHLRTAPSERPVAAVRHSWSRSDEESLYGYHVKNICLGAEENAAPEQELICTTLQGFFMDNRLSAPKGASKSGKNVSTQPFITYADTQMTPLYPPIARPVSI